MTESQVLSVPSQVERSSRSLASRLLFAATVVLGAFLLFNVQLLLGKYILPWFGGSAGVWATCLLFFQTILLAGYSYAHGLAARLNARSQVRLHTILVLLSVVFLAVAALVWPSPITPGANWKPANGEIAVWMILRVLTVSVGLPVCLLATTGPLIQRWFTYVFPGESPYRLYALSNFGSLLGLISYPLILEPALRLHTQAWVWSAGYILYAITTIACAMMVKNGAAAVPAEAEEPGAQPNANAVPTAAQKGLWVFLAAMGSLMLLAMTRYITQDVAPIPLLWVMPLAVYLLSFIVCFDHPRWYRPGIFHSYLLAMTLLILVLYHGGSLGVGTYVATALMMLFACCVFCHGELYRRRPQPQYLTSFYLMIALGGVFGSAFVNLIAPLLFKGYWELFLGIAFCLLTMAVMVLQDKTSWAYRKNPFTPFALILWSFWTMELWVFHRFETLAHFLVDWRFLALGVVALVCTALAFRSKENVGEKLAGYVPLLTRGCVLLCSIAAGAGVVWVGTQQYRHSDWAHRNFYGVLYVRQGANVNPVFNYNHFMHGTTTHGIQITSPQFRRYPVSYYSPTSGVGLTLRNYPRKASADPTAPSRGLRVGVIGLGAGTLAAYGLPGDVYRFYEIDPAVIPVASGENGYFSFLRDSQARVEIVEGDARISLERELANGQPQGYDVLVVDAFSGDSIPMHLLTKEAFELYLKHLRDENSVIAVHVTNRLLDLEAIIGAEAKYSNLNVAYIHDEGKIKDWPEGLVLSSDWMLVSRRPNLFLQPAFVKARSRIWVRRHIALWTDDYSNLLQVMR